MLMEVNMKYDVIAWGDSWATPSWYSKLPKSLEQNYNKYYHTNYILRDQYSLTLLEMARESHSNTGSQDLLLGMIDNTAILPPDIEDRNIKCDYVLWYFTELGRNFNRDSSWTYEESIEFATKEIIQRTQTCLDVLGSPKIILIECLGSPTKEILQSLPIHGIIPWRQKMLNFDKEMCALRMFSESHERLDKNNHDSFFKRNQIVKMSERDRQMYNHAREWFPDGSHPGNRAHFSLARRASFTLASIIDPLELDWNSWAEPDLPVDDLWGDTIIW